MKKIFMGGRLKRLRQERSLTQKVLAESLGLSLSYLNQIENNQRPLTAAVLLRLNALFGVDIQMFSEHEDARLVTALKDAFYDPGVEDRVTTAEIIALVSNSPTIARAVTRLHGKLLRYREQIDVFSTGIEKDRSSVNPVLPSQPFEEVRDYFYRHHNYIDDLDRCAEALARDIGLESAMDYDALTRHLRLRHQVQVCYSTEESLGSLSRRFEPENRILHLSPSLLPGQRAFQLATQIAFLEAGEMLAARCRDPSLTSDSARTLARIGLANYFAGALILSYGRFLEAAERHRYDIDLLGQTFGVGFETIAHRLSTLQRDGRRGVPFFFVRVDRAGNISKRQSAADFPFSKIGGTCPLWTVYDAFAQPGRILTQVTEMPDGRAHLWVTKAVSQMRGGHGAPRKCFAVALGCDLHHASRLVYASGHKLDDVEARTRIGAGCKVCERTGCPQRAFPFLARPLRVDETRCAFVPYAS